MSTSIIAAPAFAKINLGLEILGRRPDGMHEILTVLQTISLADQFVLEQTGEPFDYRSPAGVSPADDLVRRAIDDSNLAGSLRGRLSIEKNVPLAAGLGGGSSNLAVALQLLYPGEDRSSLAETARRYGSDAPFFLRGGTALASGTGTTLLPLPTPRLFFVLVTPRLSIPNKTGTLYTGLTTSDYSGGEAVQAMADSLREGTSLPSVPVNAFERQLERYPAVAEIQHALRQAGARWITVSGAGPTLVAIFTDQAERDAVARGVFDGPPLGQLFRAETVEAGAAREQIRRLARALRGD